MLYKAMRFFLLYFCGVNVVTVGNINNAGVARKMY